MTNRQLQTGPEVTWMCRTLSELPVSTFAVSQLEEGRWFFKLVFSDSIRVHVQADREDDAFFTVYRNGTSVDSGYGSLREVVTDIRSSVAVIR